MRLRDITIGQKVTVRRGYSRRPAIVVRIEAGVVGVHFTDTNVPPPPSHQRQFFYAATVRPNQIQPHREATQ